MSLVTGWDSYGALDSFVFKKVVLRSPNVQLLMKHAPGIGSSR